jgi:hypothetical protein
MRLKNLSPGFYMAILVSAFLSSNFALVPIRADSYGRIWDQCNSGETAWENQAGFGCPPGWEDNGIDTYTEACSASSAEWCEPRGYGGGCTRYFQLCKMIQGGENWCSHYGGTCNSNDDCCQYEGPCTWNSSAYAYTCGGV